MLPFFHVEEDGWQHVGDVEDRDKFHLIIFGGSVAFGAYASDLQKTYFSVMVRELKKRGIPIYVTIMAVGGWWSTHEVAAWATEGVGLNPHAVMFLDGLNDLTNPKEQPMVSRSKMYISNMGIAEMLAKRNSAKVIYALQPFLPSKKIKTGIEKRILELSGDEKLLVEHHGIIAEWLKNRHGDDIFLIDCSDIFTEEKETTFADIWHFSDPAHEMLGKHLAEHLYPILSLPIKQ